MSYLSGYRGDYMGGYRGDPGLFGGIFAGLKKAAGFAIDVLPGPVGVAARGIRRGITRRKQPPVQVVPYLPPPPVGRRMPLAPQVPSGGRQPVMLPDGTFKRAYRRMNVANPKALRRAIRRQAGFVKLARKALRGTGYSIVSKGSRRPSRVSVRESGPGSVIVR